MRCFVATCLAVTLCGVFGSDVYAFSNDGICSLAPETGPCRGSFVRFFYDPESRQCQSFVFGGCGGNANNFRSLEECQGACAAKEQYLDESCLPEPDTGVCRGAFPRWFFNSSTGLCQKFIYGGCGGNANNFHREEDCQVTCQAIQNYEAHDDVCTLKAETGPCRARMLRFHFNKQTGQCEQFIFGGCGGNENNFRTIEACQNRCQRNNENKADTCQQPIQPGMCLGYFPRFAFNKMSGKCERFVYGGCQANDNNFLTIEECQDTCENEQVKYIEIIKKQEEQDVCQQPIKSGMCLAYIPRFAFNEKTGKCERFIYGGCGANGNNFQTIQECRATCEKVPEDCPQIESCPRGYVCKSQPMQDKPHCSVCLCVLEQENYIETHKEKQDQDICQQPIQSGRCLAYIPRFAYNKQTGRCERFVYGGCDANGNNFETIQECKSICEKEQENYVETPREEEQDVCQQPIKPGMCLAYFPRFAFNKNTGKCERFVYGGCGANGNNFETVEQCQATCEMNTLNECPLVEPCGPGYTCHMERMEGRPQCRVCNCVPEKKAVQEVDACDQPIHSGMCLGYFPRFAFNKQTGKCERFIYGGCQANANNFETMEQCQNKCEAKANNVCSLPAETGRCLAYIPRFHFNGATGQCEQFIYGGCGGNGNNFESLAKCQSVCQNH